MTTQTLPCTECNPNIPHKSKGLHPDQHCWIPDAHPTHQGYPRNSTMRTFQSCRHCKSTRLSITKEEGHIFSITSTVRIRGGQKGRRQVTWSFNGSTGKWEETNG